MSLFENGGDTNNNASDNNMLNKALKSENFNKNSGVGSFDDANVDRDLLSQIFADDGESVNNLLNSEPKAANNKPVRETIQQSQVKIKTAVKNSIDNSFNNIKNNNTENIVKNTIPEASAPKKPEPKKPETKKLNIDKITKSEFFKNWDSSKDSIVKEDAKQAMEDDRKKGTLTIITEKTTIPGGISSGGSLEVMGTVSGDIDCLGKVYIGGIVSGNVSASDIYINTPKLIGNLKSQNKVKISVGTIIIGDVVGVSAYIAGAIKGDIDVDGPVIIDSTAIIKGDIKAKSIQINTGAIVDGCCSLNYVGVDFETIFE